MSDFDEMLGAGLLGFIGGYADDRHRSAVADEDLARREALQLRRDEAEIVKAGRIERLRMQIAREEGVRNQAAKGFINPDGTLNTQGLDDDLQAIATLGNIEQLMEEQAKRNTDDSKIRTVGPDTTVATTAQLKQQTREGPITTPGRSMSPEQLASEGRAAISDAMREIQQAYPPINATDRSNMQMISSQDVAKYPEEQALVERAFFNAAAEAVRSESRDSVRQGKAAGERETNLDSGVIVERINRRAQNMMDTYNDIINRLSTRITATSDKERRTQARSLLGSEIPNSGGKTYMGLLKENGYTNPLLEQYLINSIIDQ